MFHLSLGGTTNRLPRSGSPSWIDRFPRSGRYTLKGHCIEFKYYAGGIHSGLTPPG